MSQDIEKYRNWIRQAQHTRSNTFYYLSKALITQLGKTQGTEEIIKQVEAMGKASGEARKKMFERNGQDNSFENFSAAAMSKDNMIHFAWERAHKKVTSDERVVEFTYCPIAEGFQKHGAEGIEIGELFCDYIDNAVIQAYNSEYECVHESSLNKDGLCRLHFKKKQ
jgi:hypothetical protein